MSVGPRVVLMRFSSIHSPRLVPWMQHAQRVTGAEVVIVDGGPESADESISPVLTWSLVSGNNRELARGARVFTRFDLAAEDARRCIREGGSLEFHSQSDERAGGYGWHLDLAGVPEVTSSRWYSSDRDRRQSVLVAAAALVRATVSAGARGTRPPALATGGSER